VAKLIYSAIASLDGYVADEEGNFDWAAPDEEVYAFVNDLERRVGTYLYGRSMYEVMRYWDTAQASADRHPVEMDYARIWRSADKVVYSETLETASSAKTRIERDFDPEAVRRMKGQAGRLQRRALSRLCILCSWVPRTSPISGECPTPFREPPRFIVIAVTSVISGTFPDTYGVST
jgi:hypothetical protein